MLHIVDDVVRSRIASELERIETDEDVVIVYACESGSRAWGFPSPDSDYDVRFIYLRQPEHYTSIDLESRSDVIERPIDDALDISGWDFRKTLQLLRKSNPPLLEWLSSPVVYRDTYDVADRLRSQAKDYFSRRSCIYHYLRMAQRNLQAYLQDDTVVLKKYLYALRPVLGVIWLERREEPVPMLFQTMVDQVVDDPAVSLAIGDLLELKRTANELDRGPRSHVLGDFIESEINRMKTTGYDSRPSRPSADQLNALFRTVIKDVWGYT